MHKILGIFVSSDQHLDKIVKLSRAAKEKGVEVQIFFTHIGTRLCMDPRVKELKALATVALCKVGFESYDLNKDDALIDEKAFLSQSCHAEMIYHCDRYLTF